MKKDKSDDSMRIWTVVCNGLEKDLQMNLLFLLGKH